MMSLRGARQPVFGWSVRFLAERATRQSQFLLIEKAIASPAARNDGRERF